MTSPELFPEPEPSELPPPPAAAPALDGRPGTVLIADNDAPVNSLLQSILAEQGLDCIGVHDGEAALQRLREGGIGVLVTDLDMPKLDGRQLLDRLADLDPAPPTLVISGYLDSEVEAALRRHPSVCDVLRKPFDVVAFASQVEDLAAGTTQPETS